MATEKTTPLGDGIVYSIEGDKLTLTIDIGSSARASAPSSASGKMRMLGTTHGFAPVPGGVKVSLNVGFKA